MKIKANAKINLGLYITGLDSKNYHLLDATMIPISLYDEIDIDISNKDEDYIYIENMDIPKENTISKAINVLREYYKFDKYFNVNVNKGIPSGAGLGGGSSDAAFVMKAIMELLNLDFDINILKELALKVGADVPFFLINKPCRMEGIGEILTPFKLKRAYSFLLIKPLFGINTIEAYRKYDELNEYKKSNIDELIVLLQEGKELINVHNDLWKCARLLQPELIDLENKIREFNPKVITMSGSGSTLVVYDKEEKLKYIQNKLREEKNIELCKIVNTLSKV